MWCEGASQPHPTRAVEWWLGGREALVDNNEPYQALTNNNGLRKEVKDHNDRVVLARGGKRSRCAAEAQADRSLVCELIPRQQCRGPIEAAPPPRTGGRPGRRFHGSNAPSTLKDARNCVARCAAAPDGETGRQGARGIGEEHWFVHADVLGK